MSEETKVEVLEVEERLELKKLNTQHFWALVSMIRKGGKSAIGALQGLAIKEAALKADAEEAGKEFTEADKQAIEMERGLAIFDIAMEHAETDLQALFADIAGMTLDEYRAARFDLTFDIIQQLAEDEDLAGFFKRAAAFVQKYRPTKQKA